MDNLQVHLILDATGSMEAARQSTVGAVNEFLTGLKADPKTKKARFNLYLFNSALKPFVQQIRDKKLYKTQQLKAKEYKCQGMTPLNDAIGKVVSQLDEDANHHVVILTDGWENNSQEYSKADVKALIDNLRKKGHMVTFLGADMDAFAEAQHYGVGRGQTVSLSKGSIGQTMEILRDKTVAYASSGDATQSWSDDERKRVR